MERHLADIFDVFDVNEGLVRGNDRCGRIVGYPEVVLPVLVTSG
jgi:hypothetical protein